DRHAPDLDLRSELAQRILYQIMLSHRNAAADNENVIFHPALDRLAQRLAFVSTMFQKVYCRAATVEQCAKQRRIALVNLSEIKFLSGVHQLVTGRNDRSVNFAADVHIANALRRQQSNRCRAKSFAFGQYSLSL